MRQIRKIIPPLMLIIGILLLINGIFTAIKTNINTGTALTLLGGIFFTLYGIRYEKIAVATSAGIKRSIKYMVWIIIAIAACMMAFIACTGHNDTVKYDEDAVIVLGASVNGDKVSRTLACRLDKTVEYSKKNQGALIIVSGGQGTQEDVTEGFAMEQYLIKKGIPEDRIIKEEKATSTYENFKFSKEILDNHFKEPYTCAYITNRFHLYRAGKLGEETGLNARKLGADMDLYFVPSCYFRETLAVIKLWILKR